MGWIAAAPPGPLGGSAIHLGGAQLALLGVSAAIVVFGLIWLRRGIVALTGLPFGARADEPHGPGAAAAVLLLLCAVTLVLWISNPFAALLLTPALHLWMWIVAPDVRLPAPATVILLLAGLALPALVLVEYATTLGLGPLAAAWSWALLLAGGEVGLLSALEWQRVPGLRDQRARDRASELPGAERPEPEPVTIRGPVTYAGPGSLGGTKSALHR